MTHKIDSKKSDCNLNLKGYPCLITVGSITDRKGQINLIKSLILTGPISTTHFRFSPLWSSMILPSIF